MLSLLLTILVALIIAGLFWWVLDLVPIPVPLKQIARVIIVVILLVWLLHLVGFIGPRHVHAPW